MATLSVLNLFSSQSSLYLSLLKWFITSVKTMLHFKGYCCEWDQLIFFLKKYTYQMNWKAFSDNFRTLYRFPYRISRCLQCDTMYIDWCRLKRERTKVCCRGFIHLMTSKDIVEMTVFMRQYQICTAQTHTTGVVTFLLYLRKGNGYCLF